MKMKLLFFFVTAVSVIHCCDGAISLMSGLYFSAGDQPAGELVTKSFIYLLNIFIHPLSGSFSRQILAGCTPFAWWIGFLRAGNGM